MAEPTKVSYDTHNDNSVNTSLWTATAFGNGTITEISSADLKLDAPGTGSGGNQDKDRALIIQDTPGGHGIMISQMKYDLGATFNYVRVGVTDTQETTNPGTGWAGNYIAIRMGAYSNPQTPTNAVLDSNGVTVDTNNGPVTVAENSRFDIKIYENGDGTILVVVNGSTLAIISDANADVMASMFAQYEARSATDPGRNADLWVDETYDYDANPIPQGGAALLMALMELAGVAMVGMEQLQNILKIGYAQGKNGLYLPDPWMKRAMANRDANFAQAERIAWQQKQLAV